jgi:hypothetical protein
VGPPGSIQKGDNVEKLVKNQLPVLIWENPTCLSLTFIPNQKHSALIVGRLTHPTSNNNNSLFLSLGTCIWWNASEGMTHSIKRNCKFVYLIKINLSFGSRGLSFLGTKD